MASSEEVYKKQGVPNGISIVNFCQQQGIVLEFSDQMMDVLLRQNPQIKIMIINKLSESLLGSEVPSDQVSVDTDKESIEEKRKYYQKKYNLSDGLAKLLGAVPASSIDDNWKEAKEKYLREKYESL